MRSFHIPNVRMETLGYTIGKYASPQTHFMTDEWYAYKSMAPYFLSHQAVKHSAGEYVRGDVYTNTVEGFFSILKRGLYGTYQNGLRGAPAAVPDRVRFPVFEPGQIGRRRRRACR